MASLHTDIIVIAMQLADEWIEVAHSTDSLNPPNMQPAKSYIDKRIQDFGYAFEAILAVVKEKTK